RKSSTKDLAALKHEATEKPRDSRRLSRATYSFLWSAARSVFPICGSSTPLKKTKLRVLIWNSPQGTTTPGIWRKKHAPAFSSTRDPKTRQAFAACAMNTKSQLRFRVFEP